MIENPDGKPLRPWRCSSNSMPDIRAACRRRIRLPIFWGGHCHRCMRRAYGSSAS